MSTFTNNHTWVTGETMTAAILNGITNTLVTAGNAIDRTNLTGGAGIDASQLTPSSASAGKFGGSVAYTFPLALITTVGSNSVVPLTIQGNSGGGQTADLLDVLLAPAGQNMFKLPAAGGFQVTGPTGTQFTTQSTTGDLQIAPIINSLNTLANVIPVYTTAGAGSGTYTGPKLHAVIGGNTWVQSAPLAQTVTLTNAAVFTSSSSYIILATTTTTNSQPYTVSVAAVSGTQFTLTVTADGGTSGSGVYWMAIGI